MSTSQTNQNRLAATRAQASEIEALADDLIALLEEFEVAISEGNVQPGFADRFVQLRRTAERLIDP